jgi:hypothetical protein
MLVVLLLSGWLRSPEPASRQVREGGPPLKFYDARDNLRLDVPAEGVAQLLSANAVGVLGRRRLVWPFRNFVQWNPADDIIGWLRVRAEATSSWELSATVSGSDPGQRGPPLRDTGRL